MFANPATASNLVVNGGFESANFQTNRWTTFGEGELEGWTPFGNTRIEIRKNVVGTAYEGDHLAELDSHYNKNNAPDEIGFFQDIVTKIGQKYTLSFAYSPRNNVYGDNLLGVEFGAGTYEELDAGDSGEGWKLFQKTITATETTTRLKFWSLGKKDTLGANVDNISVVTADVPEPMSVLGLGAIAAVGAVGTLRQRTKA
ncbi:MAG: PEP-CTERM sorting domain-containing protein [Leptolyngbyaceae cyanobacterium]